MTAMEIAQCEQRKALLIQRSQSYVIGVQDSQLRERIPAQPVNDPTQLVSAVLIQNLVSPPLANIISMACTTTERHGSNYSSRHGNLQGEATLKKGGETKKKSKLCLCVSMPSHWSLIKEAFMINYVVKGGENFYFFEWMYRKISLMSCTGTWISQNVFSLLVMLCGSQLNDVLSSSRRSWYKWLHWCHEGKFFQKISHDKL